MEMAKTEPKNERLLCDAVGHFLAQRWGERIVKVELVDIVGGFDQRSGLSL